MKLKVSAQYWSFLWRWVSETWSRLPPLSAIYLRPQEVTAAWAVTQPQWRWQWTAINNTCNAWALCIRKKKKKKGKPLTTLNGRYTTSVHIFTLDPIQVFQDPRLWDLEMVSQWGGERAEIKIEMLIALLLIHCAPAGVSQQQRFKDTKRRGAGCSVYWAEGTRSRQHFPDYTDPWHGGCVVWVQKRTRGKQWGTKWMRIDGQQIPDPLAKSCLL